jgi:hypothetical protein
MTEDTKQSADLEQENPNVDGVRAAIRFPLWVLMLGIMLGAGGLFADIEWISVAGFSLVALGAGAFGLIKLLYGSEIEEK